MSVHQAGTVGYLVLFPYCGVDCAGPWHAVPRLAVYARHSEFEGIRVVQNLCQCYLVSGGSGIPEHLSKYAEIRAKLMTCMIYLTQVSISGEQLWIAGLNCF